jgi:hypothetical protein
MNLEMFQFPAMISGPVKVSVLLAHTSLNGRNYEAGSTSYNPSEFKLATAVS